MSSQGSHAAADSNATCSVLALSVATATSGSATLVTLLPSLLVV
jgi:hypothetical protein